MEYTIKEGWMLNPNEKVVKTISMLIKNNLGECPCGSNTGKTREERMCPCKSYIEGDCCHCKLYVKKTE